MKYAPATPVLVAVITRTVDWQRVQTEGWYRIPVRSAPRRISADIIAWYHTRAFGADRWCVRWYAPIERVRLQTRRELLPNEADHPHAHEHYWRLDVGPLSELPRPVPAARLRRVTFIPTRWERLLHAHDVNDLWLGDQAREELCQRLLDEGYTVTNRRLRETQQRSTTAALHVQPLLDGLQISWAGGAIRFSELDLIWHQAECVMRLKYHLQKGSA